MEPSERLLRKAPGSLAQETPERAIHPSRRLRLPTRVFQSQAGLEALLDIVPCELGSGRHSADDDEAISTRAAKKTGGTAADHGPAGALGQAAPVGLDTGVRRPPVRKAVRLGNERPNVRPRREEDP